MEHAIKFLGYSEEEIDHLSSLQKSFLKSICSESDPAWLTAEEHVLLTQSRTTAQDCEVQAITELNGTFNTLTNILTEATLQQLSIFAIPTETVLSLDEANKVVIDAMGELKFVKASLKNGVKSMWFVVHREYYVEGNKHKVARMLASEIRSKGIASVRTSFPKSYTTEELRLLTSGVNMKAAAKPGIKSEDTPGMALGKVLGTEKRTEPSHEQHTESQMEPVDGPKAGSVQLSADALTSVESVEQLCRRDVTFTIDPKSFDSFARAAKLRIMLARFEGSHIASVTDLPKPQAVAIFNHVNPALEILRTLENSDWYRAQYCFLLGQDWEDVPHDQIFFNLTEIM
jgi:hypothetical protein